VSLCGDIYPFHTGLTALFIAWRPSFSVHTEVSLLWPLAAVETALRIHVESWSKIRAERTSENIFRCETNIESLHLKVPQHGNFHIHLNDWVTHSALHRRVAAIWSIPNGMNAWAIFYAMTYLFKWNSPCYIRYTMRNTSIRNCSVLFPYVYPPALYWLNIG
jgi:hypothetical protein